MIFSKASGKQTDFPFCDSSAISVTTAFWSAERVWGWAGTGENRHESHSQETTWESASSQILFHKLSFWSYSTPRATEDGVPESNGADLTTNIPPLLLLLTESVLPTHHNCCTPALSPRQFSDTAESELERTKADCTPSDTESLSVTFPGVCAGTFLYTHVQEQQLSLAGAPLGDRFGKGKAEALPPFDKGPLLLLPIQILISAFLFLHLISSTVYSR